MVLFVGPPRRVTKGDPSLEVPHSAMQTTRLQGNRRTELLAAALEPQTVHVNCRVSGVHLLVREPFFCARYSTVCGRSLAFGGRHSTKSLPHALHSPAHPWLCAGLEGQNPAQVLDSRPPPPPGPLSFCRLQFRRWRNRRPKLCSIISIICCTNTAAHSCTWTTFCLHAKVTILLGSMHCYPLGHPAPVRRRCLR